MNIQIPDTSKGQKAMVQIKSLWYAIYYRNGKPYRRSLRTTVEKDALKFRNQFFSDLARDGATVYTGRDIVAKIQDKPNLYIYRRKPVIVKIGGKIIAECDTEAEAEVARDAWLEKC